LRGKRKSQSSYSIKLIGGDMREKGLIGKRCVREKVSVIEEIMRWNCGGRNSDVVCFGDCKKFSLASNFNFIYIYIY
jgi:hypothetical protein